MLLGRELYDPSQCAWEPIQRLPDDGTHTQQATSCINHSLISATLLRNDKWETPVQLNIRFITWSYALVYIYVPCHSFCNVSPDLDALDPHSITVRSTG